MVKTSAPGSVFFFGEHSVVYERPAIVAAIGMRTRTEIVKRGDDRISIDSVGYGKAEMNIRELERREYTSPESYKNILDPLFDLIKTFFQKTGFSSGLDVRISSDIPYMAGGMSSSTAVLSSVLGALNQLAGKGIKTGEFFDWLYPFQVKIHGGKASGSEITSSSMGGYNVVRINKSGERPKLEKKNLGRHEYMIVIGDTKVERQTKETVPYVASGWEKDKESYGAVFDRIGKIAKEGEKHLMAGDARKVGELMNQNHEILARDLGVSHPRLNRLADAARSAGAFGAKLSGAGKGGIMVALVSEKTKGAVAKAIENAGGKAYMTKVGVEGVRVE